MSRSLQKLHQDHRVLNELLFSLKCQTDAFFINKSSNIPLILAALKYISDYPERWHHPIEDIIFKRLLNYNLELRDRLLIQTTILQHQQLEALTCELLRNFDTANQNLSISMLELSSQVEFYLNLQYQHLEIEETDLFPLTYEYFNDQDWEEIDLVFSANNDNCSNELFNEILPEAFQLHNQAYDQYNSI